MELNKAEKLLDYFLRVRPPESLAVIGELAQVRKLVRENLDKFKIDYDHFVDVSTMPSKEYIQDYRRQNLATHEGGASTLSFVRAFLTLNGFLQMPEVLVLDKFNSIPPDESYFTKMLLDKNSREKDECFDRLKTVILIVGPPGTDETFDVDPDIRGCIAASVSL